MMSFFMWPGTLIGLGTWLAIAEITAFDLLYQKPKSMKRRISQETAPSSGGAFISADSLDFFRILWLYPDCPRLDGGRKGENA